MTIERLKGVPFRTWTDEDRAENKRSEVLGSFVHVLAHQNYSGEYVPNV